MLTMKEVSLLLLLAGVFCQARAQAVSSGAEQKLNKLGWLVARWEMVNQKPGQSGFEQWTRISGVELRGVGVRMAGEDTVFVEKLRIVIRDSTIYYVADVPENKVPVFFRMTEVSDHGFVFENQNHDFPKRITYQLMDRKLKATISGAGKSIDYLFARE